MAPERAGDVMGDCPSTTEEAGESPGMTPEAAGGVMGERTEAAGGVMTPGTPAASRATHPHRIQDFKQMEHVADLGTARVAQDWQYIASKERPRCGTWATGNRNSQAEHVIRYDGTRMAGGRSSARFTSMTAGLHVQTLWLSPQDVQNNNEEGKVRMHSKHHGTSAPPKVLR